MFISLFMFSLRIRPPPGPTRAVTPVPYTTLFRSLPSPGSCAGNSRSVLDRLRPVFRRRRDGGTLRRHHGGRRPLGDHGCKPLSFGAGPLAPGTDTPKICFRPLHFAALNHRPAMPLPPPPIVRPQRPPARQRHG